MLEGGGPQTGHDVAVRALVVFLSVGTGALVASALLGGGVNAGNVTGAVFLGGLMALIFLAMWRPRRGRASRG